ncbi:MAG: GldG family protein [Bdellovibrionales bacterium]|nr:GldG family protein [Bdellovibrionales bacterium]
MSKRRENYIKVFLGLFSMTLLIYIGTTIFKKARWDVTEENLYTLSDGTKSILSKLDSPVQLKLYYSKTAANKGTEALRAFNNHFLYVEDLIRQFSSYSRNNLTFEVVDPRPDTPEEEDALAYGLKKFNLTETENYFFGLVAENESGSEKVIEFFDPNQKDKLEYDLAKLIYTVLHPQKKVVGVISSLDVLTEDMPPYMMQIMKMQGKPVEQSWLVMQLLKEFYTVKKVDPTSDSISGVDTLLVIHPKGFPEKTLFAIDQFVINGGNILVLVDPTAVVDRSTGGMYGGVSSSPDANFAKLMDKWGIQLVQGTYAGDKYLSGNGRLAPNMPPSRLLAVLNCDQRCVAPYKETVSSGVKQATMVFPGVLKADERENVNHSVLMATTEKGNGYQAGPQQMGNPNALWSMFQEGKEPVVLAYKAVGKFKTAFPNGIMVSSDADDKNKATPKKLQATLESTKESAVVVFSDVDFINDQFAFRQSFLGPSVANDNSTLLLNSVEALSGDVDLLSVRAKGRVNRSFDVIDQIEFEAEKRTENKVEQINSSIQRFQAELNQLGRQANEGNIALLQNEGLKKKKELAKKIAGLKRELRNVKREGREKIENIGKLFQYLNTILVPLGNVLFGVFYSRKRNRLMHKNMS